MLVTIDTLRADRVGAYGAPAGITPHLDRIAGEGAFARRATTQGPLTRPSHVTIFTGQLPWRHGIRDNISPAEVPSAPVLAERFKGQGFATAAFVSSIVLAPHGGLASWHERTATDVEPDVPQRLPPPREGWLRT